MVGLRLVLALWLGLMLTSCALDDATFPVLPGTIGTERTFYPEERLSIQIESFAQPVDHNHPDGTRFEQQVIILRPDTAGPDAPVFFFLGNETDLTPQRLLALYRNYGSPKDIIFITADHRGYGQSIPEMDQARPAYVTIKQAMADYDRLVRHYKIRFPGAWIGGGCSYGGALLINFAHDYPKSFQTIIASSAPTRFEFETPEYGLQAAVNLGPTLASRLSFHMNALKPDALYDEKWVDRERLLALVSGLSQQQELQSLKPIIEQWSTLPTADFMNRLKTDLPSALNDRIDDWAVRRRPQAYLAPSEVRAGNHNWHIWKYQQCEQAGTFFTGGLFPQTRADHLADCRASFGRDAPYARAKPWPVGDMLRALKIPVLVISGGRDPWLSVSVKPGHSYRNIEYVHFPDGLHCPDVYGAAEGASVFNRARLLGGF